MKKVFTIPFVLVFLGCSPVFCQSSKPESTGGSSLDPTSTYQSTPFSSPGTFGSKPILEGEIQSAAPPPPVETPITGTEFLLGGGLLIGIKRTYRHFRRKRNSQV
ncbi:MAG: hypothetical protein ACKO96_27775 [Flammeovirgaceae bacterium]